jgi:ectoine hydroxylase-related dioxygenase (phytanoyl-CoA dioxygenase family)
LAQFWWESYRVGENAVLNDDRVAFYRTNGYLLVEGVLEPDVLAELRAVTDRIVATAEGLTDHTDILDLEDSHTPERPRVRRIKHPHKVDPFYWELARHPRIMDILARLLGPDIRMHKGGKINIKAGGHGAPVEWHQDWAFYPHTNDDVLAIGLLLDDVGPDNAPLLVVPGTHRGPTFDHHADGAFCGAMDPAASGFDFSKAVALTGAAGSMTIHHARLVHGSEMNRSERQRRLLLNEYTAADAWPLLGCGDFEDFEGHMVRGVSTREPRLAAAPIRMPYPIAAHQGSIYENQRATGRRFFESYSEPEKKRAEAT